MIESKLNEVRHPKEKLYFGISMFLGVALWLNIVGFIFFLAKSDHRVIPALVIYPLIFIALRWLSEQFLTVLIMGNSIKLSQSQHPELFHIVEEQSLKLNLKSQPEVFILNGEGMVNAVALQFLSRKHYVLLLSNLVDLMLQRQKIDELKMVIGHELAHHAAGHTNVWKSLLLLPSKLIPFLGTAYRRSQEYTADLIAYYLTSNLEASQRALISITSGSQSLSSQVNIKSFIDQENEISDFFGFIHNAISTYPRMTQRVKELELYARSTSRTSELMGTQV